jgi:hypothetical protein
MSKLYAVEDTPLSMALQVSARAHELTHGSIAANNGAGRDARSMYWHAFSVR